MHIVVFHNLFIFLFVYLFRAENETKAKLEKVQEIKRVNADIMTIKSEISKFEDILKEYQMYRKFLDNLTPQVCVMVALQCLF